MADRPSPCPPLAIRRRQLAHDVVREIVAAASRDGEHLPHAAALINAVDPGLDLAGIMLRPLQTARGRRALESSLDYYDNLASCALAAGRGTERKVEAMTCLASQGILGANLLEVIGGAVSPVDVPRIVDVREQAGRARALLLERAAGVATSSGCFCDLLCEPCRACRETCSGPAMSDLETVSDRAAGALRAAVSPVLTPLAVASSPGPQLMWRLLLTASRVASQDAGRNPFKTPAWGDEDDTGAREFIGGLRRAYPAAFEGLEAEAAAMLRAWADARPARAAGSSIYAAIPADECPCKYLMGPDLKHHDSHRLIDETGDDVVEAWLGSDPADDALGLGGPGALGDLYRRARGRSAAREAAHLADIMKMVAYTVSPSARP